MASLVSVIIPVFNGEKFLGEALDSVWRQSYRPLEVIVIDDGSVDGTAAIAQSNPEVKYYYQTNQGPAAARNRGIKQATGDLIAFLDQDDLWLPEKLVRQVEYLQSNFAVRFVLCHMHYFLDDGVSWPAGINRDYATGDPPAITSSALLARQRVFEQVGLFDPRYLYTDDSDWFFRAQDAGLDRRIIPEVLLHRRISGFNASLNNAQKLQLEMLHLTRASMLRRRNADKTRQQQDIRLQK